MQDFPITLIGDPNHAQAQRETVTRLKRGAKATCQHCGQPIVFNGIHGWQGEDSKTGEALPAVKADDAR